jgi:DNA end-binding protein Ku
VARRHPKKSAKKQETKSAGRAIWSGSIDFGLVTIPVKLYSAQAASSRLDFDLLDKRDFNRVRYRRVNEKTGEEVRWDEIVKGYQYEKGKYVALSESDFARANVEASRSIEIVNFVDAAEISPLYYDTPYYVEPAKNGRRAYALLRDVMSKTRKVGIAKIVLRTRQHLAALMPQREALILSTLRYAHELRPPKDLDLPAANGKTGGGAAAEIKMAEQLITAMAAKWEPERYRDTYHDDLLKLVVRKVKEGKTKSLEAPDNAPRPTRQAKVVDIMSLLKESVAQAQSKPARQRKAG